MMQHGRHARFMHERGGWRRGEMGEQGRRWGWHHDEGRRGMHWDRDDRGRLDGERERL
jgi:hypothetical protein